MTEYILELFTRYRSRGVLIDTNLLLLFVVGSVNSELIPKLSRTSNYSPQDFQIIEKAIDFFDKKITTPHVLTEVSNLVDRTELQTGLSTYVANAVENFVESNQIMANSAFSAFGLADTAILDLSANEYLVLTDDGPLFGLLTNRGVDVVSLNILRKNMF